MMLTCSEFVRCFAMHILPYGFVRIRHYGILSGTWKRDRLPALKRQPGVSRLPPEDVHQASSTHLRRCPHCKSGKLVTLIVFSTRDPPPVEICVLLNYPC